MQGLPKKVLKIIEGIIAEDFFPPEIVTSPSKAHLGAMFIMVYDAKWKSILEFWDALPLFVLIGKAADRWYGLNLHYLPYTWRVSIAKQLMTMYASKKRIQYKDVLKAIKNAKVPQGYLYFCYRTYLYTRIRSEVWEFNRMNYQQMVENVMPKFKKAGEEYIYKTLLSRFYTKIGGIKKKQK